LNFISTTSYIISLSNTYGPQFEESYWSLFILVGGNQASPWVPVAKSKKWLSACCLPRSGKHIFSIFLDIYSAWYLFASFVNHLYFSNVYVPQGFVRAVILLLLTSCDIELLICQLVPFWIICASIFMSWWQNQGHMFVQSILELFSDSTRCSSVAHLFFLLVASYLRDKLVYVTLADKNELLCLVLTTNICKCLYVCYICRYIYMVDILKKFLLTKKKEQFMQICGLLTLVLGSGIRWTLTLI